MSDEQKKPERRQKHHLLIGWGLFLLCAICFIASSLKNRDPYALAGSVVFVAACVVFLIPVFRSKKDGEDQDE